MNNVERLKLCEREIRESQERQERNAQACADDDGMLCCLPHGDRNVTGSDREWED